MKEKRKMKSEPKTEKQLNGVNLMNSKNNKHNNFNSNEKLLKKVPFDVNENNNDNNNNNFFQTSLLLNNNHDVDNDNNKQQNELSFWIKLKKYCLLILVLLLAFYCRDDYYKDNNNNLINKPSSLYPLEKLLNYEKFKARYPRIQSLRTKPSEDSRRHLLFNLDLISLGRHNLAYLIKKYSYYMRQSPFKSDRTSLEQMDVLNQLDEFNLTQILEASRKQDDYGRPIDEKSLNLNSDSYRFDRPVSGFGNNDKNGNNAAEMEKSNDINRWFKRLVKGDSYFEIPDYPLDKQPNPDKITHIDSDLRYCSSEIRDQDSCGACYAFSWNSLAEWHYCRQLNGKEQIDFSEQHIVDCGFKTKLNGCIEGLLKNVRAFSQIFGFELEKNYPWKKKEGQCKNENGSLKVKTQLTRVIVNRLEWEEILKEQPILLEVHLPSDILSYSRGVHPGNNCNKDFGHGMILVGYGRQEGIPYWLLKNSMGKKWGENGYLRLSRDAPMHECFATGFIVKFKFQSIAEENYNDFYDNIKFEPTIQPEETKIIDNNLSQMIA